MQALRPQTDNDATRGDHQPDAEAAPTTGSQFSALAPSFLAAPHDASRLCWLPVGGAPEQSLESLRVQTNDRRFRICLDRGWHSSRENHAIVAAILGCEMRLGLLASPTSSVSRTVCARRLGDCWLLELRHTRSRPQWAISRSSCCARRGVQLDR
jgi:hypothetical protein